MDYQAGTPFECALLCALFKRKMYSHHRLAEWSVAQFGGKRQVEVSTGNSDWRALKIITNVSRETFVIIFNALYFNLNLQMPHFLQPWRDLQYQAQVHDQIQVSLHRNERFQMLYIHPHQVLRVCEIPTFERHT